MNKKLLYILVLISFLISTFAFVNALVKSSPLSKAFQTAVTNSNVSVQVRGGSLTFSKVPTPSISPVDASTDDQTAAGTLGTMEVTDLRGARGTGWTVNIDSMTDYYNGAQTVSIPLANTQLSVKDLVVKKGDASFVSVPAGGMTPIDNNADHISDSAVTLAQTNSTAGGKTYNGVNVAEFGVDLNLTIPGGLPADTYTSSYTITVQ